MKILYYIVYIIVSVVNCQPGICDINDLSAINKANILNNIYMKGDFTYTYEWTKIDTTNIMIDKETKKEIDKNNIIIYAKKEIRYVFDSEKKRVYEKSISKSMTGKIHNIDSVINCDGEKIQILSYLPRGTNNLLGAIGQIYDIKQYEYMYDIKQRGGLTIIGEPIDKFLNGNYKNRQVREIKYIKNEINNGINLNKYEMSFNDYNIVIDAWLMPDRYYLPNKIIIIGDDQITTYNYEFQKDESNIWIPQKVNYVISSKNGNIIAKEEINVKEYSINKEIPDSTFIFEFPKGLKVNDFRK